MQLTTARQLKLGQQAPSQQWMSLSLQSEPRQSAPSPYPSPSVSAH
jgi:hypothetical protein